jgi:hypothetical protein
VALSELSSDSCVLCVVELNAKYEFILINHAIQKLKFTPEDDPEKGRNM